MDPVQSLDSPSGRWLTAQEVVQKLPRGYSEAALEIEEGATCPVGRDECPIGSSDLMVPRPRHAAKLDEPARHEKFVTFTRRFAQDQMVTDDVGQEAGRLHPFSRPAGAGGGPEDSMLEPLKDGLRAGGASQADFVAPHGLLETEREATRVSCDSRQIDARGRAAEMPECRHLG